MYAIKVNEENRILCATFAEFAVKEGSGQQITQADLMDGYILVAQIPDGDLSGYRYVNGDFVFDPEETQVDQPSQLDKIEAQITYTAMMTDTLLEG